MQGFYLFWYSFFHRDRKLCAHTIKPFVWISTVYLYLLLLLFIAIFRIICKLVHSFLFVIRRLFVANKDSKNLLCLYLMLFYFRNWLIVFGLHFCWCCSHHSVCGASNNKNLFIVVHFRYLNLTNPDTCIDSVSWMNMIFVKCVHESICDRFWSWVDDFTLNPFPSTLLRSSHTFSIPKNMHWRQIWAFST